MGKVLVTGSTGFIGRHLVEALVRRGDRVRCVVRPSSDLAPLSPFEVEVVRSGLDDQSALRQALQGVETVYHLAAMTSARRTAELYRVNGEGTARLAEACAACQPPPTLVYVSSVAAAGPVGRGRVRVEEDIPAPVSHYGLSKRAGELAAEQYSKSVPVTVVRPGIVFGPGNRELLPIFQSVSTIRIHVSPTFDPPPLSLIHVTDLIELLLRAQSHGSRVVAASRSAEGYYFAVAPEYPNYLQLGRLVARALNIQRVVLLPIANPLPWLIAAMTQGANFAFSRHGTFNVDKMRDAFVGSWACSADRAERELGFRVRTPLVERLRETGQWYRQQRLLNPFRRNRTPPGPAAYGSTDRRDVA